MLHEQLKPQTEKWLVILGLIGLAILIAFSIWMAFVQPGQYVPPPVMD